MSDAKAQKPTIQSRCSLNIRYRRKYLESLVRHVEEGSGRSDRSKPTDIIFTPHSPRCAGRRNFRAHMPREFDPNEPELMDRPQPVSAELEQDLDNLVALNRHFGSHRLLRRFLAGWLQPDRAYRVLDLCTGAGDLPRVMLDWARPRGIALHIDAVDSQDATLSIAEKKSADYPEIHFQKADALTYDNRLRYDFVHCSLALHHFSDENAATNDGCRGDG